MRARGFTLLELIVATAIFGVVVAAADALFESGRSVSSRAEVRARLFQAARAALRAVEEDVRGAIRSSSAFAPELIGRKGGTDADPRDTLEVVAVNQHTANAVGLGIDLSKVILGIHAERGLVRERRKILTPLTVQAGREENLQEIARDVVSLRFRYYREGEWKEEWDSTTLGRLPRAVRVAVRVLGVWREQPLEETFETSFYLPVGAEIPQESPP